MKKKKLKKHLDRIYFKTNYVNEVDLVLDFLCTIVQVSEKDKTAGNQLLNLFAYYDKVCKFCTQDKYTLGAISTSRVEGFQGVIKGQGELAQEMAQGGYTDYVKRVEDVHETYITDTLHSIFEHLSDGKVLTPFVEAYINKDTLDGQQCEVLSRQKLAI